ncbi:MAG: hypothetical protein PHU08_04585 [Dehalococcoidales bacterium]|nr:hypothetical protein [Dehalococcoidales bacterium]
MQDNLFRIFNAIAIFILGLTSSVIIHVSQITYTAIALGRGAAMSSWVTSYPWNMYAAVVFALALAYIIWYAYRQSKKDLIDEQKKNDALKQAVKDGIKEAITELKEEGKL